MDLEHQAAFVEFMGDQKRLIWTKTRIREGEFLVDLAATAAAAEWAAGHDLAGNAVTRPPRLQPVAIDESIELVVAVIGVRGGFWNADTGNVGEPGPQDVCPTPADRDPFGQVPQLNAADRGLHFGQPPVGAKRFMQILERARVRAVVNGVPAFAVVLVTPRLLPQGIVVGGDEAAFTRRRHDLVLTEREGIDMPDRTDGSAFVERAVSLGTIFNHRDAMLVRELHQRVHVARPTGEMDGDDRLGLRRYDGTNGLNGEILAVTIKVGDDRPGTSRDRTTGGSDERATGADNIVAGTNAESIQRQFQCHCAIGQRDGMFQAE